MVKIFGIVLVGLAVVFLIRRAKQASLVAEINRDAGREFLKNNALQEGVNSADSGLQWKVLEASDEIEKPGDKSGVKVHYEGRLIDGTIFDSSIENNTPMSFYLDQVVGGWSEGLQLMSKGEKVRLFFSSELGYGNQKVGDIPPGSTLIFDVELIEIYPPRDA